MSLLNLREQRCEPLLQILKLQTALFDSFTGFTVSYPRSPLIAPEPRRARRVGPQPGQIALEPWDHRWYWIDNNQGTVVRHPA